jgi:hypothetical protein
MTGFAQAWKTYGQPAASRRQLPLPLSTVALERRTHIALADLLHRAAKPGWWWSHIPSGEYRTESTARLLKRMGLRPGMFDFLLISPAGRHHWLELKRGTAPLSEAQRGFRDLLAQRGVPHAVARSFDDAVSWLKIWEVVRPIDVQ